MTDFSSTPKSNRNPDALAPMFAPPPSRSNAKTRGVFGLRKSQAAPKPKGATLARTRPNPPTTLSEDARAFESSKDVLDAPSDIFAATPTYAIQPQARGSNALTIGMASAVLLVGLSIAGWFYYQSQNDNVVARTLAPASEVASNPTTSDAPAPPTPVAPATLATPAPRNTPTHVAKATHTYRARAASDADADVSATVPAPQPSPGPTRQTAPPAPLVLNIPQTVAPPAPPVDTPAAPQAAPTPQQPPTTPPSI